MKSRFYCSQLAVLPITVLCDMSYLALSGNFNFRAVTIVLVAELIFFLGLNLLGASFLFRPVARWRPGEATAEAEAGRRRLVRLPLYAALWVGILGTLYATLIATLTQGEVASAYPAFFGLAYMFLSSVFIYGFCGAVVTYFAVSDATGTFRAELGAGAAITFAPGRMRLWHKVGLIYLILATLFVFVFVDLWLTGLVKDLQSFKFPLLDLILGLVISPVLIWLFGRDLERPISVLLRSFQAVRAGDFTVQVPMVSDDETGAIIHEFNAMVIGLRERERIREVFGRYVAHSVADEVLRKDLSLRGDVRLVTILFTDIAGYTTLSEKLTPVETVSILNEYFSFVVGIISAHQGVVNKYIGDSVLAIFNAPADDPDHAAHAVAAAVAIIRGSRDCRFGKNHDIRTRIGINTGLVVAGSIGSAERLEYTVIGDEVNVASRLEQLNKQHGTQILVGEKTRQLAGTGFSFRGIGALALKGKSEVIQVFAVEL